MATLHRNSVRKIYLAKYCTDNNINQVNPWQGGNSMKSFEICARASSLVVILLLVIIASGCGGGGESNPLQPVVPPDSTGGSEAVVITGFRLQLTDTTINSGGKAIYEYMPAEGKIIDVYNVPVSLRFRLEAEIGGHWIACLDQDSYRLDIRYVGIGSGEFAPQLTSLPPHDEAFSSTMIWWVERAKGDGRLDFVAEVHASEGILCSLAFGLYLYGSTDEDPIDPPSCRELHPAREAINGFWWDCVNGVWSDTGEPVDSPTDDNNLYPTPQAEITAYSGVGLQSIPLEVESPGGMGSIEFILWEIVSGPSGAMTVPIGKQPAIECEFYYSVVGEYKIWATPYTSEEDFQNNISPIGEKAIFTIEVING